MGRIRSMTHGQFNSLPAANPTSETPSKPADPKAGVRATRALLPEWADKPVDTAEDGSARLPGLPQGQQWDNLIDRHTDVTEKDKEGRKTLRAGRGRNVFQALLSERSADAAESPFAATQSSEMQLKRTSQKDLAPDWSDPLQRLRNVGLKMAQADGAAKPGFVTATAEGVDSEEFPLIGTSVAALGARTNFGSQETTTTKVEVDKLFRDVGDSDTGTGVADLETAPMDWYRARKMKTGERFKITTEQSTFGELGFKYTATPLPGLMSNQLFDLGPAVKTNHVVAVEGETAIEVLRGTGTEVAVTISARDERRGPRDDKALRASAGLYLDGSAIEYASRFGRRVWSKVAGKQVKKELKTNSDKRRYAERIVGDKIDKVNEYSDNYYERRSRRSKGRVTLYEMVLDLSKPKAREIYDQLMGAGQDGPRSIDFSALKNLDAHSGVKLANNYVRTASRKGIERTWAALGFSSRKGHISEYSETLQGSDASKRRIIEEKHAVEREKKSWHGKEHSQTIGRVKTVTDEKNQTSTGVGFGWHYNVKDGHTSADELAELLTFASAAADTEMTKKLQALHAVADTLPRRKHLGLAIGKRGVGKTESSFSVEMNSDAVKRLFTHFETPTAEQALWDKLADAYGKRHETNPPQWPVNHLNGDSWIAGARRKLPSFSSSDGAFMAARNALGMIKQAKASSDPVECAKKLGKGFDLLSNNLELAGVLFREARGQDKKGVDVSFQLSGEHELLACKPAEADSTGQGRQPHLAEPKPEEAPPPSNPSTLPAQAASEGPLPGPANQDNETPPPASVPVPEAAAATHVPRQPAA